MAIVALLAASAGPAADGANPLEEKIEKLAAQVAAQQRQIDELRRLLQATVPRPSGIPVVKESPVAPEEGKKTPPAPLRFEIGAASITPFGFMDLTAVYRSRTGGSGIGTNFAGIPFANTIPGQLSEFRFSAQNSRVGMRVDTWVRGARVLGYFETDFLGLSPGNAAVSSNSNSLRMRLYWLDVRKGRYEILGGQSWSLLTPNRQGLSPLPENIFNTYDIDVNYQAGLVWARNPGLRFIYHAAPRLAIGVALESAEQYAGGSAGAGVITLPSALSAAYASQLNRGASTFSVPNQRPDVIVKIAYDGRPANRRLHAELAGISRGFHFHNPVTRRSYTRQGGGGSVNLNLELVKNLVLVTNNYYSSGGGRWIFGQGPDLIIRGDGSPSLVHAASTVSGVEYRPSPNLTLYAYYGGAYFQKNAAIDPATGKRIGYGYADSPDTHNRAIQEPTLGFVNTFWRDPRWGALEFMGQYSYLMRNPWATAPGRPSSAALNMVFLNLRYLLPGMPPRTGDR